MQSAMVSLQSPMVIMKAGQVLLDRPVHCVLHRQRRRPRRFGVAMFLALRVEVDYALPQEGRREARNGIPQEHCPGRKRILEDGHGATCPIRVMRLFPDIVLCCPLVPWHLRGDVVLVDPVHDHRPRRAAVLRDITERKVGVGRNKQTILAIEVLENRVVFRYGVVSSGIQAFRQTFSPAAVALRHDRMRPKGSALGGASGMVG
mmetsp:Transcript_31597/g.87166  ORF Transcript_31597/g.87166 Transcript_31597/m.87166 type:complete len:204 (-) Transcript_31597:132-743(-)